MTTRFISRSFMFVFLTFLVSYTLTAQKNKFKQISKEALSASEHKEYPDADAAVLFRSEQVNFEYTDDGFVILRKIRERIKVYNENGFSWADHRIRLYQSKKSNDKEKVISIDAFTFNLENGKVESVKLEKAAIFREDINDYWAETKFPMPNVKAGSILEIRYQVRSPFTFQIPRFNFQENIPVDKAEYAVNIPEYFKYKSQRLGFHELEQSSSNGTGKLRFKVDTAKEGLKSRSSNARPASIAPQELLYNVSKDIFIATDVPPLEKEPYVTNMSNYASAISFELLSTHYPGGAVKSYTTSWNNIAANLDGRVGFNGILTKKNKDLDALVSESSSKNGKDKAKSIYSQVVNNFTWDGYHSSISNRTLKELLSEKTGNVAGLNLLLIRLLQEAGLDALPVVLQTRSGGFLNVSSPSLANLNYVIAELNIDGKVYYLDATNKNLPFASLPARADNIYAVRILGNTGTQFLLPNPNIASTAKVVSLTIENEKAVGKRKSRFSKTSAYYKRNELDRYKSEEERLGAAQKMDKKVKISSCDFSVPEETDKAISCDEEVDFTDYMQFIDDKIFIPQMLGMGIVRNPFESKTREFAIFFDKQRKDIVSINIAIPEGYKVESLPENFAITTEGKELQNNISATVTDGKILINYNFKRNVTIIPPEQYSSLIQIYDAMIEQSNQQIVLTKI